jgi:hypothetical protein
MPGSSQPGDDVLHMATGVGQLASNNNNENIRFFNSNGGHHVSNQQLSPESSSNPSIWSMYNGGGNAAMLVNPNNALYNRCIIGLNQLRLNEFSGFLEKRRDPEIVKNLANLSGMVFFSRALLTVVYKNRSIYGPIKTKCSEKHIYALKKLICF